MNIYLFLTLTLMLLLAFAVSGLFYCGISALIDYIDSKKNK